MGSQYTGMGRDLPSEYKYIGTFLKECDDFFGFSLSDIMFNGEATLLRQPLFCGLATFVHSLCLWKILQREYQLDSAANTAWTAMGHSMGEYTALSVVKAFRHFEGALEMTRFYAQSMQTLSNSDQAMYAMLGRQGHTIDLALLEQVVGRHEVDIANINAPNQVIISGLREGIDAAMDEFMRNESAKAVKGVFLNNVGGAYHSRFMQPAADEITGALHGGVVDLAHPERALYLNVLGDEYDASNPEHDIGHIMGQQVHGQVHWHECIRKYVASVGEDFTGTTHFVEIGPSSVLRKLVQGICRYHGYAGKFNFVGIDSAESIAGIESAL